MRAKGGQGFRVGFARAARVSAWVLAGLAAAGVAATWCSAEKELAWFQERTGAARRRLVDELVEGHGVRFYAPLDGRVPADLVSGRPLEGTGAESVSGVFGGARRFDGRRGETLVAGTVPWAGFARRGFTLSFWARFHEGEGTGGERRLVWDRDGRTGVGLRLVDGRLEASVGDAEALRVLSAPAPSAGRFAHIAFAVGGDRAALYVDGKECDACGVVPPFAFRTHHVAFGTDGHFPPSMDVDEWAVWRRPLDAGEVARLAAARKPLPALLEPELAARLHRREKRAECFRTLVGTVGAIRPGSATPAVFNPAFPVLELRLSGDDRRHFRKAHLEAVASGFRTKRGKRVRMVQASFGGKTERVAAWLDETVPVFRVSPRPSFVLASEGGLFGDGSGLVRLFPPEQWGERRPDAAKPLPLDTSLLVRLHLDGDFLGLYCLAPFEMPGPPWFAAGAREMSRPDRLHFGTPSGVPCDGAGMSGEERGAAWERMLGLLGSDPGFPLLPPEARLLARRHEERREEWRLPDPAPVPETVLGGNPAALYVTEDLDLAAAGDGWVWRSSDPGTITPEGRVVRPEDGPPRFVELAAERPGGSGCVCRFRVMPTETPLPALFLSFGRPLDKLGRTDFACFRIPAGKDGVGEWLSGGTGGGAKLRGNTSYVKGRRRSINLKFDVPVSVPGVGEPVRHLLLLSGYADASRLRNALSFHAFRAMSPEGVVRSVPVSWAEVFVNGAYAGVWECCPRLQDVLSESLDAIYKARAPGGLWTSVEASAEVVDRVDRDGSGGGGDPYAPLRDLVRFVAESDKALFAAGAEGVFDLDELVDFFLIVNFTGNEDGRVTNQFIGRRAEDGKWVLLPWDYDKTFLAGLQGKGTNAGMIVSPLFQRLFHVVPGFRQRVARRWEELRAGALSDEAVDGWIAEHGAALAPCMEEDYRVVPPLGWDGDFAGAVETLRAEAGNRLELLDRLCGELAAGR
jgi:hypothetical protein